MMGLQKLGIADGIKESLLQGRRNEKKMYGKLFMTGLNVWYRLKWVQ